MTFSKYLVGRFCALLMMGLLAACGSSESAQTDRPGGAKTVSAHTDVGKPALVKLIADYDAAFAEKDYSEIIDLSMPQALMSTIAMSEGMPADTAIDDVRSEMISVFESTFTIITSMDYEWDVTAAQINHTEAGREYALIPTSINIEMPGNSIGSTGDMIAIVDGERWYILSPSDNETLGYIEEAYPDLKSLKLKPMTMDVK